MFTGFVNKVCYIDQQLRRWNIKNSYLFYVITYFGFSKLNKPKWWQKLIKLYVVWAWAYKSLLNKLKIHHFVDGTLLVMLLWMRHLVVYLQQLETTYLFSTIRTRVVQNSLLCHRKSIRNEVKVAHNFHTQKTLILVHQKIFHGINLDGPE